MGVNVELGKTITPQAVIQEKPEVVIAGVGLKPEIPLIPGMDEIEPVQANDILSEKKEIAGRAVVLGGGSTGFEVTNMLVQHGCQVCVVEEGSSLGVGLEPLTGNVLRRRLVGRGVVFHRRARITRIAGRTLVFTDERGVEQQISFDHLVLALDWQPEDSLVNSLRGSDYQLIPVGPYQQPVGYIRAFFEGTAVGRDI
jgi:pyruvate/2-oxoglutarate dehydrogenase complex dihydrolipoamide dehydrogenase (E3) component